MAHSRMGNFVASHICIAFTVMSMTAAFNGGMPFLIALLISIGCISYYLFSLYSVVVDAKAFWGAKMSRYATKPISEQNVMVPSQYCPFCGGSVPLRGGIGLQYCSFCGKGLPSITSGNAISDIASPSNEKERRELSCPNCRNTFSSEKDRDVCPICNYLCRRGNLATTQPANAVRETDEVVEQGSNAKRTEQLEISSSNIGIRYLAGMYLDSKWFNGSIELTPEIVIFSTRNRVEKIEMKYIEAIGNGEKKPEIIMHMFDGKKVLIRTGNKRQVVDFITSYIHPRA